MFTRRNNGAQTHRRPRRWLLPLTAALAAAAAVLLTAGASRAVDPERSADSTVTLGNHSFDLTNRGDLQALVTTIDGLLGSKDDTADAADSDDGADSAPSVKQTDRSDSGMQAQGQAEQIPSDDRVSRKAVKEKTEKGQPSKDAKRGLTDIRHVAKEILKGTEPQDQGIVAIRELAGAVHNAASPPYLWLRRLDVVGWIFDVRGLTLNACGRGNAQHPASNLATPNAADLSKVDPKPTPFWSRQPDIAALDLYHGFGRHSLPNYTGTVCTYNKAHSGNGIHPSFDVLIEGEPYKAKFGKQNTEPFGARIFWALGYPQLVTDYTPELKVRYDRRIFTEFNERSTDQMMLTFLGIPIHKQTDARYLDPFPPIEYAVMKDGSHVPSKELRTRLFRADRGRLPRHPEQVPALYDKAFESRIDYLVYGPTELRPRKLGKGVKEIGWWDFNALDHPDRREVRALCVLNAWLDNWDVRTSNTRIQFAKGKNGESRVIAVQSDVGGLFGNSSGMVRPNNGTLLIGLEEINPNRYSWYFTAKQRPGQTSVPIKDYMPITKNQAFYRMNIDDARWGARLIAQLSENQIRQALIGSGFDAGTARLLLEKLIARRDKMVTDLGLAGEIPLLRQGPPDKRLTYDPVMDAPFVAKLASGETVSARAANIVVADGKLEQRSTAASVRAAERRQLEPGGSVHAAVYRDSDAERGAGAP